VSVSFDLFGTLVAVDRPTAPADAVARELAKRGVAVPDDWADAYREPHVDAAEGAEVALPTHVAAALDSRGVEYSEPAVRRAVVAAFESAVETRPGAVAAVEAAAERGPVGVLSNCSVPGLVERALSLSDLNRDLLDAVVVSVDCGWRKPDQRAFEAIAGRLGVPVEAVVHVGDDPRTDGGIEAAGGKAFLLDDTPLADVPDRLASQAGDDARAAAEGSGCR
jgi:HAD superfamily hydrolase (TIGR01549 family)